MGNSDAQIQTENYTCKLAYDRAECFSRAIAHSDVLIRTNWYAIWAASISL